MAVCGHLRPTIWRRAMPYRLGIRLGVNLRHKPLATIIGSEIPPRCDQCRKSERIHGVVRVGFVLDVARDVPVTLRLPTRWPRCLCENQAGFVRIGHH
jgi:hypothetical protein